MGGAASVRVMAAAWAAGRQGGREAGGEGRTVGEEALEGTFVVPLIMKLRGGGL